MCSVLPINKMMDQFQYLLNKLAYTNSKLPIIQILTDFPHKNALGEKLKINLKEKKE